MYIITSFMLLLPYLIAKLQSWKTIDILPPKEDTTNGSWKPSESWKLVRSAEKEMYQKMHKESKITKEMEETKEFTEEKTNSKVQEKIEKLQSLPNITPQGDIFSKHSRIAA